MGAPLNEHLASPTRAGGGVDSQAESIMVLHIDDEENQKMFFKTFIEGDSSIKVTSVEDPQLVIELVETGIYDCLITDFDMPEIDGIALSRRVRKSSDIPIIIYTGRGSEEIAEMAFQAGVDDYIRKEMAPAHYQIVSRRIRQAVERKRSNESYRSLFENANDAIYIHTFEGAFLDVNRTGCERLGYTREELLRMNVRQISPTKRGLAGYDHFVKELERKRNAIFESVNITRDGRTIPVEVSSRVIRHAGQNALMSFSRDISDRRRLEAELHLKIKTLHSHVTKMINFTSPDTILKYSFTLLREIGFTEDSSIGVVEGDNLRLILASRDALVPTSLPIGGEGIMVRCVRTGNTQLVNDTRLDPDYKLILGKNRLSELAVPVKLDGSVIAVINLEDYTPHRYTGHDKMLVEILAHHISYAIAEIRRREAQIYFRKSFQGSPAAVAIMRVSDRVITEVNDSLLRLFKLRREDVIGISTLDHPEFFRSQEQREERARIIEKGGCIRSQEVEYCDSEGMPLKVLMSSDSYTADGVDYSIVTMIDVTEIKNKEQQLQQSNERFMQVFQRNPVAMNIARLSDGTQVHVNDSCLKLFGLSRDEALGHTSEELGLFADVTCRERFVKLFREQGYVRDFRVELLDRSGRRFTALFSSDRMDVDGTDGYILNTIIDLTGIGGEAREEKS